MHPSAVSVHLFCFSCIQMVVLVQSQISICYLVLRRCCHYQFSHQDSKLLCVAAVNRFVGWCDNQASHKYQEDCWDAAESYNQTTALRLNATLLLNRWLQIFRRTHWFKLADTSCNCHQCLHFVLCKLHLFGFCKNISSFSILHYGITCWFWNTTVKSKT